MTLGRPGSVRRWLLGSAVVVVACWLFFAQTGFLGRIAVTGLALCLIIAGHHARSLAVGDEDEFRAGMRRLRGVRGRLYPDEDEPVPDLREWDVPSSHDGRFTDAPPPPIAHEESSDVGV